MCTASLPLHQLQLHAAGCNGPGKEKSVVNKNPEMIPPRQLTEPIPGLFLLEDFVTEKEEAEILAQLDGESNLYAHEFLPWKESRFNGTHFGKRWGVHCNLRDKRVDAAEHPLPYFIRQVLLPKLREINQMKGCCPNEANAIDYRKRSGHYLAAHVDDRKLSLEPIANLSLAGDCHMTFTNVAPSRNTCVAVRKVLLKRRCLQILTGKARYDFSHGIARDDLLSERRVSVTMRQSPLTDSARVDRSPAHWWKAHLTSSSPLGSFIVPSAEPVPGLFIYYDFITEEEEDVIMKVLDNEFEVKWKPERHTGSHREKRFGVDHDLWNRDVRGPKHALPAFVHTILIPKLKRVASMKGCIPNEINSIDYRKAGGNSLEAHVDDRAKHKEPIANLSLFGDCLMTYRNQSPSRHPAITEKKVLLKRRCLQVLTGSARYDFSHGISNEDLLSDRRVSLTMRETPFV